MRRGRDADAAQLPGPQQPNSRACCVTFALEMAAATDRGRIRSHNEDAMIAAPHLGYAVLADGLGGYQAGEVASRTAVDVVSATLESVLREDGADRLSDADATALVAHAIAAANSAVFEAARSRVEQSGMGTTLVVALWRRRALVAGHVGDSRLYRLRSDALRQLTHDHSLVQERIDRGILPKDEAQYAAGRAIVTRAVGLDPEVQSAVRAFDSAASDVYLLCSDGLTDMLTDGDIETVLGAYLPELQRAADALVRAANDKGGRDNISVILARLTEAERAP